MKAGTVHVEQRPAAREQHAGLIDVFATFSSVRGACRLWHSWLHVAGGMEQDRRVVVLRGATPALAAAFTEAAEEAA